MIDALADRSDQFLTTRSTLRDATVLACQDYRRPEFSDRSTALKRLRVPLAFSSLRHAVTLVTDVSAIPQVVQPTILPCGDHRQDAQHRCRRGTRQRAEAIGQHWQSTVAGLRLSRCLKAPHEVERTTWPGS